MVLSPFGVLISVYGGGGGNIPPKIGENGRESEAELSGANRRKGRKQTMVKGTTRQVILVKSPDPKLFEEAIFIVREEALAREGINADQVIRQARQAADGYLKGHRAWNRTLNGFPRLSGPLWGAAGAVLASGIWCVLFFFL